MRFKIILRLTRDMNKILIHTLYEMLWVGIFRNNVIILSNSRL
jgi:hypothetical protein